MTALRSNRRSFAAFFFADYRTEFVTAHRACKTAAEREQLELIMKARWTEAELQEFARVYYFRNAKDYPTAVSYCRAIAELGEYYEAKPSLYPPKWLREFRKGGSKPMPPRREALLKRGRGNGPEVTANEYAWPDHTEEFRSMIEQRCRAFFKDIPPDKPVHPNAWAASLRWYRSEQSDLRRAAEDAKYSLLGKALKKSPSKGYKVVSSFLYVGRSFGDGSYTKSTLRPHFEREFKGHTPEFREEVTALARKDNHLRPRVRQPQSLDGCVPPSLRTHRKNQTINTRTTSSRGFPSSARPAALYQFDYFQPGSHRPSLGS
jgi:hypothetical protein